MSTSECHCQIASRTDSAKMSTENFLTPLTIGATPMDTGHQKSKESPLNSNLVQVELFLLNGKPFDENITRADAKFIWTDIFGRQLSDLKTIDLRRIPKRCLRINFQLKEAVSIVDISDTPDLRFSRDKFGFTFNYVGRILGFNNVKPAKIGDEVTVTVLYAYPEVSVPKVARWLEIFGDVFGDPMFKEDEDNIESGSLQFKINLEHHIPEYLPIYGTKSRIFYAGMPRQCGRCYKQGHYKADCPNDKVNWSTYIEKLYDTGAYKREWFGRWLEPSTPQLKRCRSPGDIESHGKRNRSRSPRRQDHKKGNQRLAKPRSRSPTNRRLQAKRNFEPNHHSGRQNRSRSPTRQHQDYNRAKRNNRGRSPSPRRRRSPGYSPRRPQRGQVRSRTPPQHRDNYSRPKNSSRGNSKSPKQSYRKRRNSSEHASPHHTKRTNNIPRENLDENDLRHRIDDADLIQQYQEFKQFQELRKLFKVPEGKPKNPYPDGKTVRKRGPATRSRSPSPKKKKDERHVTNYSTSQFILPSVCRIGRREFEEDDSPWIKKKFGGNNGRKAKSQEKP